MKNLMTNSSIVIVGHTFPSNNTIIDLMIQSRRSVAKVEVLTFSMYRINTCLIYPYIRSCLGHMWFMTIRLWLSLHWYTNDMWCISILYHEINFRIGYDKYIILIYIYIRLRTQSIVNGVPSFFFMDGSFRIVMTLVNYLNSKSY